MRFIIEPEISEQKGDIKRIASLLAQTLEDELVEKDDYGETVPGKYMTISSGDDSVTVTGWTVTVVEERVFKFPGQT